MNNYWGLGFSRRTILNNILLNIDNLLNIDFRYFYSSQQQQQKVQMCILIHYMIIIILLWAWGPVFHPWNPYQKKLLTWWHMHVTCTTKIDRRIVFFWLGGCHHFWGWKPHKSIQVHMHLHIHIYTQTVKHKHYFKISITLQIPN